MAARDDDPIERHSSAQCPGLDPTQVWDQAAALRGTLLASDRLLAHACELAHAHGEPGPCRLAPLRHRFAEVKRDLHQAYTVLARDVRAVREPSPSEEWLLDNAHVVEEQVREVETDLPWGYLVKLPRLSHGAMRGYPRVYAICLDYLRHSDARVDPEMLIEYVRAYQSVYPLTIGELWAIPIMLRLGLLMIVSTMAQAAARDDHNERARHWASRLSATNDSTALAELAQAAGPAGFLVELERLLREHDTTSDAALRWIGEKAAALGSSIDELGRRHHLLRAGDQVSVGNSITSMRTISAFKWSRFFRATSAVEAVLVCDPAGAYALSDDETRDRCRHVVERIARRSPLSEVAVAQTALALAQAATPTYVQRQIAYYLIDCGRRELERACRSRPTLGLRARRFVEAHPAWTYLGSLALLTGCCGALVWQGLAAMGASSLVSMLVVGLALVPLSDVAMALVNTLVMIAIPPRLLARLDFDAGIPELHRTLVVVPSLLDAEDTVRQLLADLEVRALANPEEHLSFALLTDYVDADRELRENDARLLELAQQGIAQLNERYPSSDAPRFCLFHRRRIYNPLEGCFMGWERKRGKLEELNALLRGRGETTFEVVTAEPALLRNIRYVITLDADTELPRGAARRLVATLAHPLNRPHLEGRKVTRGFAILQPRVGTTPTSTRRSRFARIMAGPLGIDPYTTAVSDVYQDLFAEGSYIGKGIYDVDAFACALEGRVPDNRVLSHDLLEGLFARAALVSDIELFDDQPSSYAVYARRQHRWIRGDWQLLPWVFGRDELSPVARFKLFDNLRRSLVGPALIAAFLITLIGAPSAAPYALLGLLLAITAPLSVRLATQIARASSERAPFGSVWGDLVPSLKQSALQIAFLFDQALVSLDALVRTLHRMAISQRHLLEWQTSGEAQRLFASNGQRIEVRLRISAALALVATVGVGALEPSVFPYVLPLALVWMVCPMIARYLSAPATRIDHFSALTADDRLELRAVARRTWLFFETFVTEEDNYLPPDNYQEDPRGVVAHRTSPTNIGLYLLSSLAARDFGYATTQELITRVGQTLNTMGKLERREGHILNWYETNTLRPLEPKYVSTVDSGNLAAYLWTLKAGFDELLTRPVVGPELLDGIEDALRLAQAAQAALDPQDAQSRSRALVTLIARVRTARSAVIEGPRSAFPALRGLRAALTEHTSGAQASEWLLRASQGLDLWLTELIALTSFMELFAHVPQRLLGAPWAEQLVPIQVALDRACSLTQIAALDEQVGAPLERLIRSLSPDASATSLDALCAEGDPKEAIVYLSELAKRVDRAQSKASALVEGLLREGARAEAFANEMSFAFLFDRDRELFSIGYNLGAARLDQSYYDLLASEARVASLFALAKGEVPERHWFRLGRTRASVGTGLGNRHALLAWSGSMFEYLMPLLVTKNHEDTLLHETCESAVLAQRSYARERDVPWGISESAYNVMDLSMTYQYRAFGVQALGLKAGLADDLVVAPYATVLAAMVRPDLAMPNLRALTAEGLLGTYGYYESIDYTKSRVPPKRRGVIVKAYMAHHQGMSLVSLDNVLHDWPMQRRFHSNPSVQATELLLEERVPHAVAVVRERVLRSPAPVAGDAELSAVEHVGLAALGQPRAHLLGHGELATLVTARGTGFTIWRELDIHRFREDPQLEPSGIFVYLRDLTSDEEPWSAGFEPTRRTPKFYDASFAPHRVDIHRRDGAIETNLHVTVSPEHPADVRRITLVNHDSKPHEIEVTTYTELVLGKRDGDRAHRAFSGMFLETQALEDRGALIATRRARKGGELQPWLTQVLAPETGEWHDFQYETSREAFMGRGRGVDAPRALDVDVRLSCQAGDALDPAFALRRRVRLAPGARASIVLTTALAENLESARDLAQVFSAPSTIDRTFELAWADAVVELKHLGISAAQSHRFHRLLSAVIFPQSSYRADVAPETLHGEGKRVLWSQGLSDDLPLVIARIDQGELGDLCRELLLAHEFFRLNKVKLELLFLNEEPAGYLQPVQDQTLGLVHARLAHGQLDQRGGIFVRRASHLSPQERALLLSAGRVVLNVSHGSLSRQMRHAAERSPSLIALVPTKAATSIKAIQSKPSLVRAAVPSVPELQLDNGIGGFSSDGREYVMRIHPSSLPPAPWSNVLSNPSFGCVVTERGGGFTWSQNSQRHRLTPWSNDALRDPLGEVVYLRDDEDGSVWSATPAPCGGDETYEVRHGQGYSVFAHTRSTGSETTNGGFASSTSSGGLEHELTVFVDAEKPVKVLRLRLRNRGAKARSLSIYGAVDWVLGSHRDVSRTTVCTQWQPELNVILASNAFSAFPGRCAFFACDQRVRSATADRSELYGADGTSALPRALRHPALSGRAGFGLDPCALLQHVIVLQPNAEHEVAFVLGEGDNVDDAHALLRAFATPQLISDALARTRRTWDELLGHVEIQTNDRALDLMVNRFLPYQALACRHWARSAFYQSGGAFGYRDQLQDVLAFVHMRPDITREHLLCAAGRQFLEGDVQHWWHPETGEGVRTQCSDDMLWLPFVTAEYVRATGDFAVLDESIPFLEERCLEPGEHDIYSVPRISATSGSLYEHCLRAIDNGLTSGEHGLPLMRGGDWNDGMDRVGVQGRGESVWLGFFIVRVLKDFAEITRQRSDTQRTASLLESSKQLAVALEQHGWDGAWYRRAFCDDGTVLGSESSSECRIDAIAQSWAVLSGCADPARAARALQEAEMQLVQGDIMMLLTPPFTGAVADPGYIRAYPPGVRENGGQYTHGVLWMVQALLQSGEADRGYALLSMLNPIHHTNSAERIARYKIEPYVIAADVYSSPAHLGRGGWSWYTGAAGWMYRIAIEHLLGLGLHHGKLRIAPNLPSQITSYRIIYRSGGSTLQIEVSVDEAARSVSATLDGRAVPANAVPIPKDGATHVLRVRVPARATHQLAPVPPAAQGHQSRIG